jgi:hypothetical protein
MKMRHLLLCALWVLLIPMAHSQSFPVVLSTQGGQATQVFADPGESGEFQFELRNPSDAASANFLLQAGTWPPSIYDPSDWLFEALDPSLCGQPIHSVIASVGLLTFYGYRIAVAPVPAHGEVICRYRVSRAAESHSDLSLRFAAVDLAGTALLPSQSVLLRLGSLAHLNFSIEPLCAATANPAVRTVEITLRNDGPSAIDPVNFGTCLDNVFPAFLIDANIPMGCGPAEGSVLCFDQGIAWRSPALAAGETWQCRMQLDSGAFTSGVDSLLLQVDEYYTGDGRTIHEIATTRPSDALSVSEAVPICPTGNAQAEVIPLFPVHRSWAMSLLISTLLLIGWHGLRRM